MCNGIPTIVLCLDRNRHGGGVLMYVRCSLQTQVLSFGPSDLELLLISVNNFNHRYFISLFYRPLTNNSVRAIESLSIFMNFVLIGAFKNTLVY